MMSIALPHARGHVTTNPAQVGLKQRVDESFDRHQLPSQEMNSFITMRSYFGSILCFAVCPL
jgi:hypothetical protein